MAADAKSPASRTGTSTPHKEKGIRLFSYPKIVFMYPTMIVALICSLGMWAIGDPTEGQRAAVTQAKIQAGETPKASQTPAPTKHERFHAPENLMAVLFLGVFSFNLLLMALDFPRFTILAGIFLGGFALFFFLWIGAYFDFELMRAIRRLMAGVYTFANGEFYFLIALILGLILGVIYATRWLDYWQILPNEILHHHGPLSDLERYPTTNLKFDKEIPDVLEFMTLGAGRLVLHVADEKKSIVLENVLFINTVERGLKNMMSRMEVRVTTDQEANSV